MFLVIRWINVCYLQVAIRGVVGNRELILYTGIGLYPQLTITKFELGADNTYHQYTEGFWYTGGSKGQLSNF